MFTSLEIRKSFDKGPPLWRCFFIFKRAYFFRKRLNDCFCLFTVLYSFTFTRSLGRLDFHSVEDIIDEFKHYILLIFSSSHRRCSVRKGVLRNFSKFTGKQLYQSLYFDKVAGLEPATLIKWRLLHRCFPVNFTKFLRTPFLQNTCGRLLLHFNTLFINTFQ